MQFHPYYINGTHPCTILQAAGGRMSFFYSIYFAPATDVSAEAISAICSAGAENRRIVGATLDQASTAALGKALHGWSHLKSLSLAYNSFDSSFNEQALLQIVQAVLQVDDMKVFTPPTLVAAEVFDATIQSRPLSSCAFRFLGSE